MELQQKKILKAVSLELRHLLEGCYDGAGNWHPGDLEQRLAAIGVRRDREPVKVEELPHLSPIDRKAREVVDAYLCSAARPALRMKRPWPSLSARRPTRGPTGSWPSAAWKPVS